MRPSVISDVLDLAVRARKNGHVFNPLLVGPPGLGKSEIVQSWCRKNNYDFVDLRAAYLEAPDLVGFPFVVNQNGRQITVRATPEFWPTSGKGVIFLDEVNRGTTSVMNTFMQLLTDRKVDKYSLPEEWIVVSAVNPEDEHHDVNSMDSAMKDRFEMFHVEYSKEDFINFMRANDWDPVIISFIESNTWQYLRPEEVSKNEGAKYLSPRSFSKLNAAMKAGIPDTKDNELERTIYTNILGKITGASFYHYKYNEQPVLYRDLVNKKTRQAALAKIKEFSAGKDAKYGILSITNRDIIENHEIANDLLVEVCLAEPADLAPQLIKEIEFKRGLEPKELLRRLTSDYPELTKYLKDVLRQ